MSMLIKKPYLIWKKPKQNLAKVESGLCPKGGRKDCSRSLKDLGK